MYNKYFKDFFILLFLLIVAAIDIYFIPAPLNRILFLAVLPVTWYTKKDYLWLAFFFIVEDLPGGLFSGGTKDDMYRLPWYTLIPGISFSIREIYLLLMLVKVSFCKKYKYNHIQPFFKREIQALAVLFILLVAVSPFLGVTFDTFRYISKTIINLTLFYSIFYLVPDKKSFDSFLYVLLPFTFIALIFQLYSITVHHTFVELIKPGAAVQGVFSENPNVIERPIEIPHILLINFIGTFYFILSDKNSVRYYTIINILCYISIIMTATRSWFISFSLAYIIFLFFSGIKIRKLLSITLSVAIIILIISSFFPIIIQQGDSAWTRLKTIELLAQGDITAGGTLSRFDVRAPTVLETYKKTTIILGDAFGKVHQKYQDIHVGYYNLLLNVGVIGILLFLCLFVRLFGVSFRQLKRNRLILAPLIGLVIILILNVATQFIGFNVLMTIRFFIQAFMLLFFSIVHNTKKTSLCN